MISDVWKKMSDDPIAAGYILKEIGIPGPDEKSMSECRRLCEENLCKEYGTTWGCPPGIGTEAECLKIVSKYRNAAVIIIRREDLDTKNMDAMIELGREHQQVCRKFGNLLRKAGYDALPMADGGCSYCAICTYPKEPCRFPAQRITSIAAYGIMMDKYMETNGIDFKFEENAATLFGLVLYNAPD
jgi:predicted metal-binding protein